MPLHPAASAAATEAAATPAAARGKAATGNLAAATAARVAAVAAAAAAQQTAAVLAAAAVLVVLRVIPEVTAVRGQMEMAAKRKGVLLVLALRSKLRLPRGARRRRYMTRRCMKR
jgi:hypothetical protein